jgi:HAD superfamily hydrolase (TIGR01509 family)
MTIKAIMMDFDGTLCQLVEAHYISLNQAITEIAGMQYTITREEQNKTFNGLSTKTKLKMLVESKGLLQEYVKPINDLKQKYTVEYIENKISENLTLKKDLQKLKSEGYLIYCVSNAMYQTVELGLKKLGIFDIFDHIVGNDSVKRQKPAPDIYLQSFLHASLDPKECLIIEDSGHGRESAQRSGAYVCTVDCEKDTTYEHIKNVINSLPTKKHKWIDNKLNIVLPMAGAGSRFSLMGFELPKPLINVNGKPMIQQVVENMNVEANFIFIVQKSHYQQYNLGYLLPLIAPNCKIVQLDGMTEGAACSVLKAKKFINNDNHLFIINSDQYLEWDSIDFFNKMLVSKADGGIINFKKENDPKWSYVKLNEDNFIIDVQEKNPISNLATIGGYYFNKGEDFVSAAEEMIVNQDKTNNEYYLAPTYNYLIKHNKKIISYEIPTSSFWGLGTPEDYQLFLDNYKG